MKTNFAFAVLLGGLLGGVLVWLAVRPSGPVEAQPWGATAVSEETRGTEAVDVRAVGAAGLAEARPWAERKATGGTNGTKGSRTEGQAAVEVAVKTTAPGHIDMEALRASLPGEATVISDVVVPVPSEIFHALDKIAKPNWLEVLRPVKAGLYPKGGPEEIALMLGAVIAEGFIAVEAENPAEVNRIGRAVLTLSEALGIRNSVVRRSEAILEAADVRNWRQVRKELDGALSDVRSAMVELQSQALAQLVSLGGWLRGMEALATVVDKRYTPESAELLHQRGLVDHFDRQLGHMRRDLSEGMSVARMREGLAEIRPMMGAGTQVPSPDDVRRIRDISAWLVPFIY